MDSRFKVNGVSNTSVIEPGSRVVLEVDLRALKEIRDAHPGIQIHTPDGQMIFVTASSRLTTERLNLSPGQRATVVFSLDMNLVTLIYTQGKHA